ncbi:hypothetical protein AKO1_001727 [Acrasis kona]|uniref:Uncharacterized protein n=1 Tax=Acrasis kona TaxID=1008807 RepID=A0AAW2Z9W4_9EUKA
MYKILGAFSIASATVAYILSRSKLIDAEGMLDRQESEYKDSFAIPFAQKDTKVDVLKLVQAFYTSPLFKLERFIIKIIADVKTSDEQIKKSNFNVGDEVLIWKVVNRTQDEVLLHWSYKGFEGSTWFKVNNGELKFGSGLPIKVGFVSTALHQIYSRLLLFGAKRNLNK